MWNRCWSGLVPYRKRGAGFQPAWRKCAVGTEAFVHAFLVELTGLRFCESTGEATDCNRSSCQPAASCRCATLIESNQGYPTFAARRLRSGQVGNLSPRWVLRQTSSTIIESVKRYSSWKFCASHLATTSPRSAELSITTAVRPSSKPDSAR